MTIPQIIDFILLVIVFLCAVKGFKNGFFTALVNLIGSIVSLILAWIVSNRYSGIIFENLLREKVIDSTYKYIQDSANNLDIRSLLENIISGLPENFMDKFIDSIVVKAENIMAELATPSMEVAVNIVDTIIAPAVTVVIGIVIFCIVFTVCNIIAGLLSKLFRAINAIPVVGFANRLAGFGIGLCTGAINVFLISCLLSIIAIITQNSLSFLNIEVLAQSKILAMTQSINPFMG